MSTILCVDIGNTHIVLAVMSNENKIASTRIPSTALQSSQPYALEIESLLESVPMLAKNINACVISSVVPRLTETIKKVCDKLFSQESLLIDYTLPLDLTIKYDDPSEIGADRICNAVGAYNRYPGPLIVVDMGTATTFDIVSKQNEYLGGVIMPGLKTAGQALFDRAEKLQDVRFEFPKHIIGKNTKEGVQSGLMWGNVDQIDGMIKRISDELNYKDISVIATGGLADIIAPHSQYIQETNKTLTLLGMVDIFKFLRSQT